MTLKTPLRAVLFDLDGTILDRLSSLRVYAYMVVERLPDVFGRVPFAEYMDRLIELDAHGHGDKYKVFRRLESEFGMAPGGWQRLLDDYETYFPHVSVPFPKAHQTLSTLSDRGFKMGLVTNGPVESQQPKIDGLGIAHYFEAILISGVEGVSKPDPEIFRRAASRLGVAPEETVMVGDNSVADIGGAKAFGMQAIWKRDEYWDAPEAVDGVVDDLEELPGLIKALA